MNFIASWFSDIRWQDIADVVLNSYIIFRLYVLFRGTHVIRVLAGLALLWVFQRIALSLGLIVTNWAMQGIITGAALIIIIVFRNEIRNVLQAKNLRAILWGFPQKEVHTPIDNIVEGVYDLARRRIGALIVLPGKDDLPESVQGGIPWQGLVSREMLLSVFWNGNPVHDGAAIIRGDRITQVGSILPLSDRDDLPRYFGTRHRAALGLVEATDALVLVVSEERGQVIVAKNNTYHFIYDNLNLKRLLNDHFGIGDDQRAGIKRETVELSMAAAVCVFLMIGIWSSFAKGLETLTSFEVPLEYTNRDPRMKILSASANTVRLHLSGSGTLINSMQPGRVKVKLDLSNAVDGENTFKITSENIAIPPGVRLNRIEPPEVNVSLDMPVTKQLPVQVDWIGKLSPELILEKVEVIPLEIMVEGGGRVLSEISTLYTEKVNLGKLKKSGQMAVNISLEPASLKIINGYPNKVDVRFTLQRRGD